MAQGHISLSGCDSELQDVIPYGDQIQGPKGDLGFEGKDTT
jgi:hypothetical protein